MRNEWHWCYCCSGCNDELPFSLTCHEEEAVYLYGNQTLSPLKYQLKKGTQIALLLHANARSIGLKMINRKNIIFKLSKPCETNPVTSIWKCHPFSNLFWTFRNLQILLLFVHWRIHFLRAAFLSHNKREKEKHDTKTFIWNDTESTGLA